jgi:hypothetical protein
MKIAVSIIIVFGMLSDSLPTAHGVTFGDPAPYFSFTFGDGTGMPADVPNVTGHQTNANLVKLYGDFGPIDGARFESGFVLYWNGTFDGPISPGDTLLADLTFDVMATGGSLEWGFYSNLWSNEGFEQARILTGLMPVPASGHAVDAHYESSPFTEYGDTGIFSGYLHVNWTGYSPTDTFSISVPQDSIDITYVPEPGVVLIALTAWPFIPSLRLRRRLDHRAARRSCSGQ